MEGEFFFRKRHLTSQNVVDRAEMRRNRQDFWRVTGLSFQEHQRYLKLAIGVSLVLFAVVLYFLVRP
jgi:hypothetical protein